LKAILNIIC